MLSHAKAPHCGEGVTVKLLYPQFNDGRKLVSFHVIEFYCPTLQICHEEQNLIRSEHNPAMSSLVVVVAGLVS